jgi:pimeloyl-ACP methyl ester carboxylesterase
MNLFDVKTIRKKTCINLHDVEYQVLIDGSGSIPCLSIGIGTLSQRTMSKAFRELFTLYTSDFYWAQPQKNSTIDQMTIKSICTDIIETAKQLDLKNYILLGHSVFGGLAMEVAKYQDPELRGVIAIGATPGWNTEIIEFKDNYFEKNASLQRKLRFKKLQQEYSQLKSNEESLASTNAYYAESPKYFAEAITREEMSKLWSGIQCNDDSINHLFNDLLPYYSWNLNVDKVQVPVIVAGGSKDFDSVPLKIWDNYSTPNHFKLVDCGPTGHWPHLEAPEVFDKHIKQWVEKIA